MNVALRYVPRHRQHFRSDVLITFHPPTPFTPSVRTLLQKSHNTTNTHTPTQSNPELLAPVDFAHIRALTTRMQRQISAGTYDAPSWDIVRCAKLAARVYAPLGTHMALGEHVRVCRAFVEAFKWAEAEGKADGSATAGGGTTSGEDEEDEEVVKKKCAFVNALRRDLKVYSVLYSNVAYK